MSETKRLGRGLEALLGPMSRDQAEASGALREIPLSSISPNPWQPRQTFDDDALTELTASIEAGDISVVDKNGQPMTAESIADFLNDKSNKA